MAAKSPPAADKPSDGREPAHAMVRLRGEDTQAFTKANRIGWAEWHRQACVRNLGSLAAVQRAAAGKNATVEDICRQADLLHAAHLFCPDGGRYELAADGRQITCSSHGSTTAPRQVEPPVGATAGSRSLNASAQLLFLDDGLRAVFTIRR